jgi:hypothetical protein
MPEAISSITKNRDLQSKLITGKASTACSEQRVVKSAPIARQLPSYSYAGKGFKSPVSRKNSCHVAAKLAKKIYACLPVSWRP